MANLLKVKKHRIERKYDKLIAKTLERMKDNTMQELWVELDKLKLQMGKELIEAGIVES